jgi:hypothetical protein
MDKSKKSRLVLRRNAKEQMSTSSVHFTGEPTVNLQLTICIANRSVFAGSNFSSTADLRRYRGYAVAAHCFLPASA